MISVVIPTHKPKHLEKTLESLSKSFPLEFEVIVCENPEITHEVTEIVNKFYMLNIKHIYSALGANNARNTGIAHTEGSIIALTDDDCIVDPYWLVEVHKTFQDKKVSCVGGKVELNCNHVTLLQSLILSKVDWGNTLTHRDLKDNEHLVSANLAFTRDTYDKVGGFNNVLGYFGRLNFMANDEVLFIRDAKRFGKVVYNDNMIVKHLVDDRMNLTFFLKRSYGQGYADVLLNKVQGIDGFDYEDNIYYNSTNSIDIKLQLAKTLGTIHAINNVEPTQEIYDSLERLVNVK